ncbi:Lateral signaling target protein [Heracleum sosnowskyi]|uniref:Lateral signaling target protein n=1 Tax=Heracleum sosnowskyi TaxID=360622 RepID=A0AAD8JD10_9APIA|nr:Lateral signaling target protein [Heracleum sosnowskyi]
MSHLDFEALKELHNTANNLLHSPVMKQALFSHQQEKHVNEVSEASLCMLDDCGTTKDVLLLVKDHLQELQSTFRRISIGETATTESKLSGFYIHRKKLRKELLNCSLKGMKNNDIMNNDLYSIDHNLGVVVNVLREVRATNISIVESLMSLMSMPSPVCKSNRGSFRSKFMRVNSLSLWKNCDMKTFQTGNRILEAVETAIEDLEVELDCIFRRLIRTRVSLLNIFTT